MLWQNTPGVVLVTRQILRQMCVVVWCYLNPGQVLNLSSVPGGQGNSSLPMPVLCARSPSIGWWLCWLKGVFLSGCLQGVCSMTAHDLVQRRCSVYIALACRPVLTPCNKLVGPIPHMFHKPILSAIILLPDVFVYRLPAHEVCRLNWHQHVGWYSWHSMVGCSSCCLHSHQLKA